MLIKDWWVAERYLRQTKSSNHNYNLGSLNSCTKTSKPKYGHAKTIPNKSFLSKSSKKYSSHKKMSPCSKIFSCRLTDSKNLPPTPKIPKPTNTKTNNILCLIFALGKMKMATCVWSCSTCSKCRWGMRWKANFQGFLTK